MVRNMSTRGHRRKTSSCLRENGNAVLHPFVAIGSLDVPVERFLSMLCFENRGELDDLGLDS